MTSNTYTRRSLAWPVAAWAATTLSGPLAANYLIKHSFPSVDLSHIIEGELPVRSIVNPRPSEYKEQTGKDWCGGNIVENVLNSFGLDDRGHAKFYLPESWRWNGYSLPSHLENTLSEYGVSVRKERAEDLTDDEKIRYIKSEIVQDHPVILAVGYPKDRRDYSGDLSDWLAHYVTVWGYDGDTVFVYDPRRNDSKVKSLDVGNKQTTWKDLLKIWEGPWFYRGWNIAMPVSKPDSVNVAQSSLI